MESILIENFLCTLTTNFLSAIVNSLRSLMARSPASGLLYSQNPNACSLPVAPCTRFQLMTGPQVVSRWRTIASGARSVMLPTKTVTAGPVGTSRRGRACSASH